MPSLTVGKDALSYCSSCKMDLNHTIVSMKGDKLHRVQCRTCKKEHVFKAPKGLTEPATDKPEKKARAKKSSEPKVDHSIGAEWEKLMASHKHLPTKPYSTKMHFALGEKISHPTFGDGIIAKHIHPNKVEVVFQTDLKVLIHSGTV
ncbi:MAG: hypothetical protein H7222_11795 [Methylotenera sp.]|nr:hypothetical protein [Oligoflexia bacterium]